MISKPIERNTVNRFWTGTIRCSGCVSGPHFYHPYANHDREIQRGIPHLHGYTAGDPIALSAVYSPPFDGKDNDPVDGC
jgi:hypothetical protein